MEDYLLYGTLESILVWKTRRKRSGMRNRPVIDDPTDCIVGFNIELKRTGEAFFANG